MEWSVFYRQTNLRFKRRLKRLLFCSVGVVLLDMRKMYFYTCIFLMGNWYVLLQVKFRYVLSAEQTHNRPKKIPF